jgi:hypothetical protein
MPIGVGVNCGVERVSSLTQWFLRERSVRSRSQQVVLRIPGIPQLVYSNTQDSLDQLVSCGPLKGHGTGEANEITSTGTTPHRPPPTPSGSSRATSSFPPPSTLAPSRQEPTTSS